MGLGVRHPENRGTTWKAGCPLAEKTHPLNGHGGPETTSVDKREPKYLWRNRNELNNVSERRKTYSQTGSIRGCSLLLLRRQGNRSLDLILKISKLNFFFFFAFFPQQTTQNVLYIVEDTPPTRNIMSGSPRMQFYASTPDLC